MTDKKNIIDNDSILWGDDLKRELGEGTLLKIAAQSFSIYAFDALREQLEKIDELRFIFTDPTFVAGQSADKLPREPREFLIPKLNRERSLYGSDYEIRLRNRLTQKAIARECAEWIRRKAAFRSNKTQTRMQQFACAQTGAKSALYAPINGFTAVDLGYERDDSYSYLFFKDDSGDAARRWASVFDEMWGDADKIQDVTDRICETIASAYKENSPEFIYFLMLNNIFSEFLDSVDEDVLPKDRTGYQNTLVWKKLYSFQRDAAVGVINKLETHNGCILADSVGLGKTFTALAVIKYYELRNHRVLVLCPKKLSENWRAYTANLKTNIFAQDRFNYDVFYHTDLSRESGESNGIPLNQVNWGNYDLVVIDESHNFRNASQAGGGAEDEDGKKETRYGSLLNKVIRSGIQTKVLMLSATPVNNRFADLRNQLALAYEGDFRRLPQKLGVDRPIEEIFRRAQWAFNEWSKLEPQRRTPQAIRDRLDFDFFKLLDGVTIARSRRHIQTFYDAAEIGPFPKRLKPLTLQCPLTDRKDALSFDDIARRLSGLNLSVYTPFKYIHASKRERYEEQYDTLTKGAGKLRQADRENSLSAMMAVNLLKRLESSVQAFRLTLKALQSKISSALDDVERFKRSGGKIDDLAAREWGAPNGFELDDADDEESEAQLESATRGKIKIRLSDMDRLSWERDLRSDAKAIGDLLSEMGKIDPDSDAKLCHLKRLLRKKIAEPINPGNKKVLIFTAFADTADYLYDNLEQEALRRFGVHAAKITGGGTQSNLKSRRRKAAYGYPELLTLFSPRSKEKALTLPDEPREIDLLIGTDCISEGQNLQDCDFLINYDIHWNPVRIVQRFGRIDRIGSPNAAIQMANYWPDVSLDEYIKLKERVENRMVIANVSASGDDNPLNAGDNDLSFRKEQLLRLKDEAIEMEDVKTGVSITDLGLNDFRMDLLDYVKKNGELTRAPNGMHAVIPADPEKGLPPGVIFALRNRNEGVNVGMRNRLHPYYLIYVDKQGRVVADASEAKRLLDLTRRACKGRAEPIPQAYIPFNEETDDGRRMEKYSRLLDKAIRSLIESKRQEDLDSLFKGGRTTALTGVIAGLDDFELIGFLVIEDPQ